MSEPKDHVALNRAAWDELAAEHEEPGRRHWSSQDPTWGIWGVPETQVNMLPDVRGLDTIELGCGTAYVSAWLARRGARPVGLDNSRAQLTNARRFQREFGLEFPLIHANAEAVPLADGSFDLAISEYGACLWCDPYRWIPEAARLLRRGGRLIFLTNTPLSVLCMNETEAEGPAGDRLLRDYFGMHRFEWADDPAIEFHLGHGDLVRLLRSNGFDVEDLIEIQPPASSQTRYPYISLEWARRWPCEEIWKARKAST
jgi:SAM-dependent methyltransferase